MILEKNKKEKVVASGGLSKNDSHKLIDLMLYHQRVALFERIRRCSLDGGSMSLRVNFHVSKVHSKFRISFPVTCGYVWRTLIYFSSTMYACIWPYFSP